MDLPERHTLFFPAKLNSRASYSGLRKFIDRLTPNQKEIFKSTAFGHWLDVPMSRGDAIVLHLLFLHEIQPTEEQIQQQVLNFGFGDRVLTFGSYEFCLITGFKFGNWQPNVQKTVVELKKKKVREMRMKNIVVEEPEEIPLLFRQRVFPNKTDSGLTVGTLQQLVEGPGMAALSDEDAVRATLLYVLLVGFLGKEIREKVTNERLLLVDDLKLWNRYAWESAIWDNSYREFRKIFRKIYNHERSLNGLTVVDNSTGVPPLRYTVSGFLYPLKEGREPRSRMKLKKAELESAYYKQFLRFIAGNASPANSPPRRRAEYKGEVCEDEGLRSRHLWGLRAHRFKEIKIHNHRFKKIKTHNHQLRKCWN